MKGAAIEYDGRYRESLKDVKGAGIEYDDRYRDSLRSAKGAAVGYNDSIDIDVDDARESLKAAKGALIGQEREEREEEQERREEEEQEEHLRSTDNIEMDFFLLTCICCKANLVEEYPSKRTVINEDTMKLWLVAQREHIEMRKFHLWIELQLRHKYDLPKLKGFKKFLSRFSLSDEAKKKLSELKALYRHGANYELPEMVRKFKKHKDHNEYKEGEYLHKIVDRSNEYWSDFARKNEEYLLSLQLEDSSMDALFSGVFLKICKFLYYIRLLGLTLNAFSSDIERMCGFMEYHKITFQVMTKHNVWRQIYGEHLDFVITEIHSDKLKYYKLENGFQSFCDKSAGFVRACYNGDYTKFGRYLAKYLCLYGKELGVHHKLTVDDMVAMLVKLLNDNRNFLKMLYKSMERNRREYERKRMKRDRSKEEEDEEDLFEDDDDDDDQQEEPAKMDAFEHIVAVIILHLSNLETDGQRYDPDDDVYKQTDSKINVVMRKCDELRIDEKTKSMIKYFFRCYFKPDIAEFAFKDVCTLAPAVKTGCLIQ